VVIRQKRKWSQSKVIYYHEYRSITIIDYDIYGRFTL